ncbi:MAG TPA: phage Gp37/Gp68 family protein, partial [Thermoplasmata archaeon]|nr:phage Gp37/Gp68 family protein [Thermoplasmata archaeon]
AKRLQAMGQPNYRNGFKLTLHPHMLKRPLEWKKPSQIFVNSMSDLFHQDIPLEFILQVFDTIKEANWHQFQVLTKRSERLLTFSPKINWPDNVWMGVSIENQDYTYRVDHLRKTGARIKFLSMEPLIGPVGSINLADIDWVIVGGESGPGSRPIEKDWVLEIKNQCNNENIPFFFKQWGGTNKKKTGRMLQGRTWDELPKNANLNLNPHVTHA